MRIVQVNSIVAACFLCLLCGACQRRETSPQLKQQTPSVAIQSPGPPAKVDNRPVIVAFGDSLTAGVAGKSYPEALQDLIDSKTLNYRVDNQGVSGDTSTDGLARIDNVISQHPVLVLLEFGGNDGLRGVPVSATEKNLDEMIHRLKQASIPLVLLGITLPPNYGPDYVVPFTAMFPKLAQENNLKLFPFLLVHVYQNAALMQPDGIHPNGEGNKIVARDVLTLIQPILARAAHR